MNRLRWVLASAAIAALPIIAATSTAAKNPKGSSAPAPVAKGMAMLSAKALAAHDQFLASDLLEGRGPGTRGDEIAQQYLAAQFEAYGLQPAGDNGTYYQSVPLLGIATDRGKTSLAFAKNGTAIGGALTFGDQVVGQNQTQVESDTIDSDLVFVGHGVVAPEYRWDDYKGLDTAARRWSCWSTTRPRTPRSPISSKERRARTTAAGRTNTRSERPGMPPASS